MPRHRRGLLGEGSDQMVAGVERESPCASPAGRQAAGRYYRCIDTGSRRKGCGNMVRMEMADTTVEEIMATTFGVSVKRLVLVTGTHYQDQMDEISYRI